MTFAEFCVFYVKYRTENIYQREGQALYNSATLVRPEFDSLIWQTHLDAFNNDKAVPALWEWLGVNW